MKRYNVYRNGTKTFSERIKAAFEYHVEYYGGAVPTEILVNPADVKDAQKTIDGIGVYCKAKSSGGALLGEVWIETA